jgi:hypothetical protein
VIPTLVSPLISAKILADSISPHGVRLTTMELVYPRFIHAELMTHRVFSRNASSSRAIPTKRAIKMIRENPAVPASWRMNQPGMQGYEVASEKIALQAQWIWLDAMEDAIRHAERMDALGIHKQVVNRLTEPYAHIKVVLTSVYWENWNGLRNHHAADPTIEALAVAICDAREASKPTPLGYEEWHLPYVTATERRDLDIQTLLKVSAARCARVSYNNHDGSQSKVDADCLLHDRLLIDQPIHASPAEHQATPDYFHVSGLGGAGRWATPSKHGNLAGFIQYRKTLENENMDTVI